MKLLVLASTLDLRYRLGCTPAWWQLLKAFHETGDEVLVAPYLGDPIETPWWKPVANPASWQSRAFLAASSRSPVLAAKKGPSEKAAKWLIRNHIKPLWRRHLAKVLAKEEPDAVFLMNVPLNHITGIPTWMREEFGVRVGYYDGDMPTILPATALERGFRFSYYEGADLSEYDAFFSNSKGVLPELARMGAKDPQPLYYAADPDLYFPQPATNAADVADVAFFGYGSQLREDWMTKMIAGPSQRMPQRRFVVGGGGFQVGLGAARQVGDVPIAAFGRFVGNARVNLNITRTSHTTVYASATARPFELAAYGACIVSQPYEGIEEWFAPGRDLEVVQSEDEAVELYGALLGDDERRAEMGRSARQAILDRHTFRHRAAQVRAALTA